MNLQPSFASEGTFTPDDLLISGPTTSESIVLASGAGVLTRGTVIGKITASGKYLKSLSAAVDGSQTPDLILAEDVDATSADKTTLAYASGVFNSGALILGSAHTIASIKEGLRAKNIQIQAANAVR